MNKKRAQVNQYDQLKIDNSLISAPVPISITFDDSRSRAAVTGKGDQRCQEKTNPEQKQGVFLYQFVSFAFCVVFMAFVMHIVKESSRFNLQTWVFVTLQVQQKHQDNYVDSNRNIPVYTCTQSCTWITFLVMWGQFKLIRIRILNGGQ